MDASPSSSASSRPAHHQQQSGQCGFPSAHAFALSAFANFLAISCFYQFST
jgi:hypothetical protein